MVDTRPALLCSAASATRPAPKAPVPHEPQLTQATLHDPTPSRSAPRSSAIISSHQQPPSRPAPRPFDGSSVDLAQPPSAHVSCASNASWFSSIAHWSISQCSRSVSDRSRRASRRFGIGLGALGALGCAPLLVGSPLAGRWPATAAPIAPGALAAPVAPAATPATACSAVLVPASLKLSPPLAARGLSPWGEAPGRRWLG